jgi:hypothetical protein
MPARPLRPRGCGPGPAFEGREIVGFEAGERSIENVPARHDDDIDTRRDAVASEELPCEAFRAVSLNGRTKLSGCRHSQPCRPAAVRRDEHEHITPLEPCARVVGPFEIGSSPDATVTRQPLGPRGCRASRCQRSSATVRRVRPLARRRFSTIRPFLVDMRIRNPWAFFRRRVFG